LPSGTVDAIQDGRIQVIGHDDDGAVQAIYQEKKGVIPKRVWNMPSHNAENGGSSLLSRLIPNRRFPFPKSLYAVEDALRFFVADKPDAVILDFFSGSGTTAHAVMRLNRQDGGHRQCISVTNNEVAADEQKALREQGLRPGDAAWEQHGICDFITKPRVEAAITGRTPDGLPIKGDYKFTDEFPMAEESARTLLGRLLFSEDDVFKPVSALSGGERSRLALAKLTLARANFLVLDEPTNHLDIAAREALEGVLDDYDGTLLFVSHDRYFIDRLATQVWAIGENSLITPYLGNYTDYLRAAGRGEKREERGERREERERKGEARAASNGKANGMATSPASAPAAAKAAPDGDNRRTRGGEERRQRERQRQLAETEKQISAWEERLNQIRDELEQAGASGQVERLTQLSQEYDRLHEQLEGLYSRWSQLTAELDELATVS